MGIGLKPGKAILLAVDAAQCTGIRGIIQEKKDFMEEDPSDDILDVFPGKKARFVRNFMHGASSIGNAVERYVKAVKDGSFPAEEHTF